MTSFYPYSGSNYTQFATGDSSQSQATSNSFHAYSDVGDPYGNRQESYNVNLSTNSASFAQQSQHQQPIPTFWNPAVAATLSAAASSAAGNPNIMFDMGLKAGQTFLDQGTAKMIPGLERTMKYLRVYFAVDNSYVKRKMQRVLFPFLCKKWKRLEADSFHSSNNIPDISYALPHIDDNAFDLYIPSMSLITYVLLCGLCYGTAGQFDPQVLQTVTTKCFVTQIIEVLAIRVGFYLMQAPIDFMDLFAVTGYKYLGLCTNLLVGLLLGQLLPTMTGALTSYRGYYITFLWTASAASYFMLKTMANNIPRVTAATGPKREFMVLGFAASQFATMWFLGQTKFLI